MGRLSSSRGAKSSAHSRPARAARIKRVLGTGKQLIVADFPFNTIDHFLLAQLVVDTGFARSLKREGEGFRLSLFCSLPPGERRRLLLWSPLDGMTILSVSEISTEDGGRAWVFGAAWKTDTLLAAVAYEGHCLAAAWCGQEQRFYDPHSTDGADPITRIALIRWCRLPGLRHDPDAHRAAAHRPIGVLPGGDACAVALLDDGLPADLEMEFEDRQSPRGELFKVIFHEAYIRPTQGKVEEVFNGLPNDFDRLMTYHPLLGCRALQAVLSRLVRQSKVQTRALLVAMQLQLLSLRGSAGEHDMARQEGELRNRARSTFSENSEPMDDSEWRKLVEPIMEHLSPAHCIGQPGGR